MSAYVPRHAPAPRVSPVTILLAGLDAAVLAVAVLALILASLALARPVPAVLSAPVSAPASVHPGQLPVAAQRPARPRPAAPLPYMVQRGDSLWSVAAWYYGSGASWPRIWAANRAVVGPDPNRLRPGEHLTFP